MRILFLTLAAACLGATATAGEIDPGAKVHAERLAIGTCGTCHGPRGVSTLPKYPRLAAQNAGYLVAQLKGFRSQTRGDPDAVGYMWGMAANLDDETIEALAAYYAAQPPPPPIAGQPAEVVARGREIYEHGIESKDLPACGACHGPVGEGMAAFPRLAAQHAQYVLKQLTSFQSNMRNVAVMHGVAVTLQVPEMEAVAAFLQAQP
jgi:cytochrome c553